jgi:hypothetical protein
VNVGIVIKPVDDGFDVGLSGAGGKFFVIRANPDGLAVRVLHRDVLRTRPVVADQHCAQSYATSEDGQTRYAVSELHLDATRETLSVE